MIGDAGPNGIDRLTSADYRLTDTTRQDHYALLLFGDTEASLDVIPEQRALVRSGSDGTADIE